MRSTLVGLLVAPLLASGALTFARGRHRGNGDHHHHGHRRYWRM